MSLPQLLKHTKNRNKTLSTLDTWLLRGKRQATTTTTATETHSKRAMRTCDACELKTELNWTELTPTSLAIYRL